MWFTDINGELINSRLVVRIGVRRGAEFFRVLAIVTGDPFNQHAILFQTLVEDEAIDYMEKLYKKLSVID